MTRTQFERLLASLPENVRSQTSTPEGKLRLADKLAEMTILAQEARRLGLPAKPEVATQLKLQEENLLANALYQHFMQTAQPSEADFKAAAEARKSEFEQAKARHILIRFQGSVVPLRKDQKELTEAEALAKATALRARIVKGEDFAAIAKAESDDTGSGASGGDLGEVTRGRTIPEFENAIFTLPINQVSEPLKTKFGYHLIQVQERGVNAEKVTAVLANEIATAQIKALHDKAKIVLSDSYFGSQPALDAAGAKPTPGTPAAKPAAAASDSSIRGEVERIELGRHSALPAPVASSAPAGVSSGAINRTVENGTNYTLTVFFAGPTEKRITLEPGAKEQFELLPGSYKVAARVTAPNVLPFYGVQSYSLGQGYTSRFFIRSGF